MIEIENEATLSLLGIAGGFMSTYFELQNTLIDRLVTRGVESAIAARYTHALWEGLSTTAMHTPEEARAQLPLDHETRHGLNERARGFLREAGWFAMIDQVIETLERRTDLTREPPRS